MKVRELIGLNTFKAFNVYVRMTIALWIADKTGRYQSQKDVTDHIDELDDDERRDLFKRGLIILDIEPEEALALGAFAEDPNGVVYGASQFNRMTFDELCTVLCEVCLAISKMKVFF